MCSERWRSLVRLPRCTGLRRLRRLVHPSTWSHPVADHPAACFPETLTPPLTGVESAQIQIREFLFIIHHFALNTGGGRASGFQAPHGHAMLRNRKDPQISLHGCEKAATTGE